VGVSIHVRTSRGANTNSTFRSTNGTGPLATNGIEAGVKIRPTEAELDMMDKWPCPEFRSGWDSYFKDKPDKPVMHYSVIAGWFGDHMVMPPGKFFTMARIFEA
jgi:alcohol oxidase